MQGIITGIGFIGGGAILKHEDGVSGTASAASIWNTGAIGLALMAGARAQSLPESQFGLASIGYRWNAAIGTALGYRLFDVEYDSGGFSYDVRQAGWQLGLTWRF